MLPHSKEVASFESCQLVALCVEFACSSHARVGSLQVLQLCLVCGLCPL